jgi:hypothetical protein
VEESDAGRPGSLGKYWMKSKKIAGIVDVRHIDNEGVLLRRKCAVREEQHIFQTINTTDYRSSERHRRLGIDGVRRYGCPLC